MKTTARKHPALSLLCSPGTVVRAWELSVSTEAGETGPRPSSPEFFRLGQVRKMALRPESPRALPQ